MKNLRHGGGLEVKVRANFKKLRASPLPSPLSHFRPQVALGPCALFLPSLFYSSPVTSRE